MVIVDILLREKFYEDLNHSYKKKDWRNVLMLSEKYGTEITSEILWVFPTVDCLKHQEKLLKSFNIRNILSVGCGSGLLEFVFHESLGLVSINLVYRIKY